MTVAQSTPWDELSKKGFFIQDKLELPEPFTDRSGAKDDELGVALTDRNTGNSADDRPVGVVIQTFVLFVRELKNLRRDTVAVASRFGLTIFISVLVGVIFLDVGNADSAEPQVRRTAPMTCRMLALCSKVLMHIF
jgi:hypothetical protein